MPIGQALKLNAIAFAAFAGFLPGILHGAIGEGSASMLTFSGFGTAGVVRSSDTRADFTNNAYQPKGPGFSRRWSTTPDSKLGVQVIAGLSDKLSATVQLVAQYQFDATFTPYVEWANLKYQVTPDFSVRVGRTALPTFMYSDAVNVGYALPYVRIPMEIYGHLPVNRSDGVDLSYRFHARGFTNTLQTFAGRYDTKVTDDIDYNIRNLRGIVNSLEYGNLVLRASYQKLGYSYGSIIVDNTQEIAAIGLSYDPGPWFVLAERIRVPDHQEGLFRGGYLLGGYRMGKFTPYVGYAHTDRENAGTLDISAIIDQDTTTAGLRWDLARNVDLKLQLDHTRRHGGLHIYFVNQQPDFRADSSVNLLSLAVDFVF